MNEADDPVAPVLRGLKPRRDPPAAVQAAAFHAVHAAWQAERRRRWQWPAGLAAAVLVAVTLGLIRVDAPADFCLQLQPGGRLHVEGGTGDVAEGEVCVDGQAAMLAEATSRVVLPDGVEARIREGTRLQWAGPASVRLEHGALHVDTHGTGNLVVSTPFGQVRDIGTVFSTDVDGQRLVVSLHEGSVEIESVRGRHRSTAAGNLGERVTVNTQRVLAEPLAGIDPALDWIFTGHPGYSERRADVLIEQIARDMHLAVQYAGDDLRLRAQRTELEGSLDRLGPRDALQVVAGVCGFTAREQDGKLVIGGAGLR